MTNEGVTGGVLPLLRQWQEASDAGDRDAAVGIECTVVKGLSPPDDGTGEARAHIAKSFAGALATADEEAARKILDDVRESLQEAVGVLDASRVGDLRLSVPIPAIKGRYPPPLLALAGKLGSVVSEGSVGVLSGAGGVAKTAFVLHQGLAFANAPPGEATRLHGGMFDAPNGGGPVLYLTFENEPPVARDPLLALAAVLDGGDSGPFHDAAGDVHVLDMMEYPLFGPTVRGPSAGLYNARPGRLVGWESFEHAVKLVGARLVIVDPVLCAYVGESSSVPAVRDFLAALTSLARAHRLGIILIAHATKSARKSGDPLDVGQIGGTDHWSSGVRGTLVLSHDESRAGGRLLACPKANRGPDQILIPVDGIRGSEGEYLGLCVADDLGWRDPPPPKDKQQGGRANGRARSGNGVGINYLPENPHE